MLADARVELNEDIVDNVESDEVVVADGRVEFVEVVVRLESGKDAVPVTLVSSDNVVDSVADIVHAAWRFWMFAVVSGNCKYGSVGNARLLGA